MDVIGLKRNSVDGRGGVTFLLWVVGVQSGSMASAHALRASRLLAYARQL